MCPRHYTISRKLLDGDVLWQCFYFNGTIAQSQQKFWFNSRGNAFPIFYFPVFVSLDFCSALTGATPCVCLPLLWLKVALWCVCFAFAFLLHWASLACPLPSLLITLFVILANSHLILLAFFWNIQTQLRTATLSELLRSKHLKLSHCDVKFEPQQVVLTLKTSQPPKVVDLCL